MSLKDNILEKLYMLLNEHKISQEKIEKSEAILLTKHYKNLIVGNFENEYIEFDNLKEFQNLSTKMNVPTQQLLLSAVIGFFANFICSLPSKEERLEIFASLTPSFKLIYESLYEVLR